MYKFHVRDWLTEHVVIRESRDKPIVLFHLLEDLIIAAHNNAKSALKDKTANEISKMTNQFGIPGFKWPF